MIQNPEIANLDENKKGPSDPTLDQEQVEVFQRLHLCTYLSELPEIGPGDTEDPHLKSP